MRLIGKIRMVHEVLYHGSSHSACNPTLSQSNIGPFSILLMFSVWLLFLSYENYKTLGDVRLTTTPPYPRTMR